VKKKEMGRVFVCVWHVWGNRRGVYRVLVGRPEGMGLLGRSRCRWEDNIKMNLQELGWGNMNWIDVASGRRRWRTLLNAVMNLRVA
jgi:hypothetical protein